MYTKLKNRIKILNRYRTDNTISQDALDEILSRFLLNGCSDIFGYIVGVSGINSEASRLEMENSAVGDFILNRFKHYYILLEDGYVSKDLGSDGDSGAREELFNHLTQEAVDSYVELDDIIL